MRAGYRGKIIIALLPLVEHHRAQLDRLVTHNNERATVLIEGQTLGI